MRDTENKSYEGTAFIAGVIISGMVSSAIAWAWLRADLIDNCNTQKFFIENYQIYSCAPTGKWVNQANESK